MSELDQALRRLDQALGAAEAAVVRALDAADAARAREQELTAFSDDRQRLAELLDVSAAQAEAAERTRQETAEEIGRRLDGAIAIVESVLAEAEA
ncbi:DUF4164 family protein [Hansschlegelia sp. KR7-227]|uniref:DUF4164 family protein n=1 Tax=Hansschlegelia sp. KR7-227 TaxID=3400914 RepID=UPI003BFE9C96